VPDLFGAGTYAASDNALQHQIVVWLCKSNQLVNISDITLQVSLICPCTGIE